MSQPENKQQEQASNNSSQSTPQFMNSLSEECNILKFQYDECFNSWFSEKFLQGNKDLSVCDPYMKLYSDCVKRAMLAKGIDTAESDRDVLRTDTEFKMPQ